MHCCCCFFLNKEILSLCYNDESNKQIYLSGIVNKLKQTLSEILSHIVCLHF